MSQAVSTQAAGSETVTRPVRRLRHPRPAVLGLAAILAASMLSPSAARATTIERVVSPGGVEAWLVHDSAVPLVTISFSFKGGASQDPDDKAGVAYLAAGLLDEGAGDLDAQAFHDRLERKAIEFGVRADQDQLRGTLRTLSENRDEAFDLLKLALTAPRFDTEAVERVRAQVLSGLHRETTSPNDIASRRWWDAAFPGHPYGRPVNGTLESVPRIATDDLRAYARHVLARDQLKIAVVGDIDVAALKKMLDRVFGSLPAKGELKPVADAVPQGVGRKIAVSLDVPQAVVTFGGPGIARHDPDFMAAYVVNHILGGGTMTSRLYTEVREKRGLAYSVYDSLVWLDHTAVFTGGTATRSDRATETVDLIQSEIHRLAEAGPTEAELADAKSYLASSFALGLDTSVKIAGQLIQMQLDDLGIDYIDRRVAMIDAVTLDDAKRVARRLLNGGLLVTVVGRQPGLTPVGQGAPPIPATPPTGQHLPAPGQGG